MAQVARDEVLSWLTQQLQPERFKDYGPNGLQVEGADAVRHVVSGVTASLALIEQAVAVGADTILVHHGLFWRGQSGAVTGWMAKRLRLLLAHNINLLAYHLPMDAHALWGNNAQLGVKLGFQASAQRFGDQDLGWVGEVLPQSLRTLSQQVESRLGRAPTVVGNVDQMIGRVGWCTGGAQGYFEAAVDAGVDAFLTGEISEPQAHLARECGVAFLACGHHATERYGAPALGQALADVFGVTHQFIDVDNPA
jgi:dinuclear metal center YbgI/SA1388 family protein